MLLAEQVHGKAPTCLTQIKARLLMGTSDSKFTLHQPVMAEYRGPWTSRWGCFYSFHAPVEILLFEKFHKKAMGTIIPWYSGLHGPGRGHRASVGRSPQAGPGPLSTGNVWIPAWFKWQQSNFMLNISGFIGPFSCKESFIRTCSKRDKITVLRSLEVCGVPCALRSTQRVTKRLSVQITHNSPVGN